jgi:hypothetical protein
VRALIPLVVLSACEPGPNEETLVESLQIVAAVAEPPEVAPFEPYSLTATVVDPVGEGFEVLMWTCLDDCESVRPDVDGTQAAAMVASVAPVPGWILACAPGLCDLDDPRQRDLKDPFGWLQSLPIEGVSLVSRLPRLTEETEDRHVNPLIEEEPSEAKLEDVGAESSVRLTFLVPGAETAWTYTTLGGFRRPSEDIASDGAVTVEWFAPKKPQTAALFVVFVDGLGGSVVWEGTATMKGAAVVRE